jgi:Uncharacterized conserved protein (some members contain a von Willebrand factor type A (vWA) domain)
MTTRADAAETTRAPADAPSDTPGRHATFEHRWLPSPALPAAVASALGFAAIGLVLSRPDVVVLALPFVATAGWAWARRPRSTRSEVEIGLGEAPVASDATRGARVLRYTASFATLPEVQSVHVRYRAQGVDASRATLAAHGPKPARLTGEIPVLHSGPHEFLRLDYRLTALDAAFVSEPSRPVHVDRVVPAPFTPIASLPLPRRLQGLTGAHDSARPGDGGEFHDVHPFHPGDRLRRIDWKATARLARNPGDLFVRRSAATADATVLIVLDSASDVGESVADWPGSTPTLTGVTSMDLGREAASSLAAGYVRAGDQVAFLDLTATSRMVPQGSGGRHLQRVLRAIAMTAATGRPFMRHRAPIVPQGAIVYLVSPLLDDETARLAALWRSSGHRVIAVDVLPTPHTDRLTREQHAAHHILSMERNDRLRALTASGVEVIRFSDDGVPGARDARLRVLARPRRQHA